MGGIGWPELVILGVLLLFVGALVLGVVLLATGKGKGGEHACGGCGALVRWLEQQHCSQCGADLRTVGVKRVSARGGAAVGLAIVAACLVLGVSCCGLLGVGLFFARSTTVVTPPIQQSQPAPSSAEPIEAETTEGDFGLDEEPDDLPVPLEDEGG